MHKCVQIFLSTYQVNRQWPSGKVAVHKSDCGYNLSRNKNKSKNILDKFQHQLTLLLIAQRAVKFC